jgi:thiamine-phosphate pyrophosphorylase
MTPRETIAGARLYLVCDARPQAFLEAALRGGVDVIQLRDKTLPDADLVAAAEAFRAAADAHGALFVLNDRPELVAACRADGVHVGQGDASPAAARALVGPDAIVGRSTHEPAQAHAADADPGRRLPGGRARARDAHQARAAGGRARLRRPRRRPRRPAVVRHRGPSRGQRARGARPRRLPHRRRAGDRGRARSEHAARELRAALESPVGAAQP